MSLPGMRETQILQINVSLKIFTKIRLIKKLEVLSCDKIIITLTNGVTLKLSTLVMCSEKKFHMKKYRLQVIFTWQTHHSG